MSDIVKSTSIFHDGEKPSEAKDKPQPVASSARDLFNAYGKTNAPKPRKIEFEVRVLEGDSSDEYTVEAHSYYFEHDILFFLLDNHIVWFTPVRNLVYVNIPEED